MFFIGIFGIESKEKSIGKINDFSCKNCRHNHAEIIKSYHFFHFFFIPVFRWKEMYYCICDQCKSIYGISKEKGKAYEKCGEKISYWDLKALQVNNTPLTCPFCQNEVKEAFEYCPYCGKTLSEIKRK